MFHMIYIMLMFIDKMVCICKKIFDASYDLYVVDVYGQNGLHLLEVI